MSAYRPVHQASSSGVHFRNCDTSVGDSQSPYAMHHPPQRSSPPTPSHQFSEYDAVYAAYMAEQHGQRYGSEDTGNGSQTDWTLQGEALVSAMHQQHNTSDIHQYSSYMNLSEVVGGKGGIIAPLRIRCSIAKVGANWGSRRRRIYPPTTPAGRLCIARLSTASYGVSVYLVRLVG
jgi:hypothetical protein